MNDSELRSFFQSYGDAFLRTPADIADFYAAPCITARQGQVRLNVTHADVEAFFTDVLARYRAQGSAGGEIETFASTPLGVNSIAATIKWAYKDSSGSVLWEWTFTYNLYRVSDGWKILLQTLHDAA
jgi:hypothetical protein